MRKRWMGALAAAVVLAACRPGVAKAGEVTPADCAALRAGALNQAQTILGFRKLAFDIAREAVEKVGSTDDENLSGQFDRMTKAGQVFDSKKVLAMGEVLDRLCPR